MKLLTLLGLILISSCGVDIGGLESLESIEAEVETDIPDQISLEPDFEKAAKFCDDRYGAKTVESENCFEDFRNYYDPELRLDFQGITNFCQDNFETAEEVDECEQNLIDLLGGNDEQ